MVEVKLTDDEALVLFEFATRFENEEVLRIDDSSEMYALWVLQGRLAEKLVEPFKENYSELLEASRTELRERFGGDPG